ncbi:MAG: hypothetical protein P9X24_07480 [Candidatus Hatepunaea meridiana]|nr:hypothetical protein [Candidatus Hatepunaea meridiana]
MPKDRIILLIIGIFAITTAIGGYTGLFKKLTRDPYYDLKQESYLVIDKTQLWFVRPLKYNGGGKSYIGLDFQKIGLSNQPNSLNWKGKFGLYTIMNIHRTSFDLLIKAKDNTKFIVEKIRFDTRPVLIKQNK